MQWILIIVWAATGNGYTTQEFDTKTACENAGTWAKVNNPRGGATNFTCLPKG